MSFHYIICQKDNSVKVSSNTVSSNAAAERLIINNERNNYNVDIKYNSENEFEYIEYKRNEIIVRNSKDKEIYFSNGKIENVIKVDYICSENEKVPFIEVYGYDLTGEGIDEVDTGKETGTWWTAGSLLDDG